jgi:outer membrane lipoprotein SlyB
MARGVEWGSVDTVRTSAGSAGSSALGVAFGCSCGRWGGGSGRRVGRGPGRSVAKCDGRASFHVVFLPLRLRSAMPLWACASRGYTAVRA